MDFTNLLVGITKPFVWHFEEDLSNVSAAGSSFKRFNFEVFSAQFFTFAVLIQLNVPFFLFFVYHMSVFQIHVTWLNSIWQSLVNFPIFLNASKCLCYVLTIQHSLCYIYSVFRCLKTMYQLYPRVHQTSKLIFLKVLIIIMSLGGVLQFTNCRVFILVLWLCVARVLTKLRFWWLLIFNLQFTHGYNTLIFTST